MRINENFTYEMINDLHKENVRLEKLDKLNLNEKEKDIINYICSDIFKWASAADEQETYYKTFTYKLNHPETVDKEKIQEWFSIQGFVPYTFMLKEDEIGVII